VEENASSPMLVTMSDDDDDERSSSPLQRHQPQQQQLTSIDQELIDTFASDQKFVFLVGHNSNRDQ
jgi:hypothetical protein